MASTSAVSMSIMQLTPPPTTKSKLYSSESFFRPLAVKPSKPIVASRGKKLQVKASLKEKAITGLTAAALTASMVMPEVAEATGSGVSPTLKNFLLSIASGGGVVAGIIGAVVALSNFDPVKRG